MKYVVEMRSMICITSLVKICSGIQRLMGGGYRHKAWRLHKPTFIFFKIRQVA
jgi:hypothetical protein